jgi:hypothetical protein
MASKRMSVDTAAELRPLAKSEIDAMISGVIASVALHFADIQPERITYLGEEILAIPVDTRRFAEVMSRYLILN